jgi:hypothetical protein
MNEEWWRNIFEWTFGRAPEGMEREIKIMQDKSDRFCEDMRTVVRNPRMLSAVPGDAVVRVLLERKLEERFISGSTAVWGIVSVLVVGDEIMQGCKRSLVDRPCAFD